MIYLNLQPNNQHSLDSLVKIVSDLQNHQVAPNSVWHDVFVGIGSSILSSIIITAGVLFFSKRFKKAFTYVFGLYTNTDIVYVYENKADAEKYILKAISNAKKVYIITSRGREFQSPNFQPLWPHLQSRATNVKVIMPDPERKDAEFDFINQRQVEISDLDSEMTGLRQAIIDNISYLTRKNVNYRVAKIPHFVKIVITDKYLFLEPYNKHWLGHKDRVMQYRRGDTYNCFSRYFDLIWNSVN